MAKTNSRDDAKSLVFNIAYLMAAVVYPAGNVPRPRRWGVEKTHTRAVRPHNKQWSVARSCRLFSFLTHDTVNRFLMSLLADR